MNIIDEKQIHPNLRVPWKSKEDKFVPDFDKQFDESEIRKFELKVKNYELENPISEKIKEIPHIKLDLPEIDYIKSWDEVQTIDMNTYSQVNLRNYKERFKEIYMNYIF